MTTIRHQPQHDDITADEREALRHLDEAGAWTLEESLQHLEKHRRMQLFQQGYITVAVTAMGPLVFLRAQGRVAAYGRVGTPRSFTSQLNRAYTRLALQRLGWTVLGHSPLTRFDLREELLPVRTTEGDVLSALHFGTGLGYSREKLKQLVARWRSQALVNGLTVVIVTPNARRARRIREREHSWLRFQPCHPFRRKGGRLMWEQGTEDSNAVATTPEKTVRLAQARQALDVDTVLSATQLWRYYRLNSKNLCGWPHVHTVQHPVHTRYGLDVATPLYLASSRMQYLHDNHLAHRAGLAEMRHQLGAPADPNVWAVEPRSPLGYEQPDAVWTTVEGQVAVEFDTGSYSGRVINNKLETFQDRDFIRTVWGVTSATRQRRLSNLFDAEVLLADWFPQPALSAEADTDD